MAAPRATTTLPDPGLTALRRWQLDEIARLEAAWDVLPPAVQDRIDALADGQIRPPPAIDAQAQPDLMALSAASRSQWLIVKQAVRRCRETRAKAGNASAGPALDRALRLRVDARAALAAWADLRRRIAALRAGLSGDSRR